MVLQEEIQKLLLMTPLNFVVVLHGVRMVGAALRRSALRKERGGSKSEENCGNQDFHGLLRREDFSPRAGGPQENCKCQSARFTKTVGPQRVQEAAAASVLAVCDTRKN